MSVLVEAAQLGLLMIMSGMAAISASVLAKRIEEEDAGSAWVWTWAFVATSLVTDLLFWRLP